MAEGYVARSPDPSFKKIVLDLRSLEAGTAFLFVLSTLRLRIFAIDWSALSPFGTKPTCCSATCPNIGFSPIDRGANLNPGHRWRDLLPCATLLRIEEFPR